MVLFTIWPPLAQLQCNAEHIIFLLLFVSKTREFELLFESRVPRKSLSQSDYKSLRLSTIGFSKKKHIEM